MLHCGESFFFHLKKSETFWTKNHEFLNQFATLGMNANTTVTSAAVAQQESQS